MGEAFCSIAEKPCPSAYNEPMKTDSLFYTFSNSPPSLTPWDCPHKLLTSTPLTPLRSNN